MKCGSTHLSLLLKRGRPSIHNSAKELLEIQHVPIRGQLLMRQSMGQRPQPEAYWTHSTLDPILCGPRKSYSH